MTPIPDAVIRQTKAKLIQVATGFHGEAPERIHDHRVDAGGAPEWSAQFLGWITRGTGPRRSPNDQYRVKRAMRMLRQEAPREYDVVLRAILGDSIFGIQEWLNERAIRGGHPERYTLKDTVFLLISGVDKVAQWM